MTHKLIIFAIVNFFAAILSGASGGGGGLISTPFMVLLGLPPATAIATAKFGGFGMSLGASTRFFREKITDKRTVIVFSLLGGVGALIGSIVLTHNSDQTAIIQKIMGATILFIGIPMLYFRDMGLQKKERPTWLKIIGLALIIVTVMFQAAIGTGIGSLQLIVLMGCFGMTALVASATRRAVQLTVAMISLTVYIVAGLVNYRFGIIALLTSLIGGFIGAHIAVKKGNKFIINLFAVVSALLAIQLIFGK